MQTQEVNNTNICNDMKAKKVTVWGKKKYTHKIAYFYICTQIPIKISAHTHRTI